MTLLIIQGTEWIGAAKTLTAAGALALLFLLFLWKGVPWIRKLIEQKDELLRQEIADARTERDEQRRLRTEELKQFMSALRRQDETHKKGFQAIVNAIQNPKKKT